MRLLLCLLLLLVIPVWPQELPIEIDLSPPPADYEVDIQLTPATPEEPSWTAPRQPCPLCREAAKVKLCGCYRPLTQNLAEELLIELTVQINDIFKGQLKLPTAITVQVVSHARLQQMGGEPVLGLYENRTIWLSQNLNRRRALAVMAHEYGHAWQYLHRSDIDSVRELLFEGFAEWVSYKIVASIGDRKSVASIKEDNSVYGRGARWFLAQEAKLGLFDTLQLALKER